MSLKLSFLGGCVLGCCLTLVLSASSSFALASESLEECVKDCYDDASKGHRECLSDRIACDKEANKKTEPDRTISLARCDADMYKCFLKKGVDQDDIDDLNECMTGCFSKSTTAVDLY